MDPRAGPGNGSVGLSLVSSNPAAGQRSITELLAAFARAQQPPLMPQEADFRLPSLARAEWEYIQRALAETAGNVTQAARALRISRKSLQTKMKELGLRDKD